MELVRTSVSFKLRKEARQQDHDLRLVVGHLSILNGVDEALERSQQRPGRSIPNPIPSLPRCRKTSPDDQRSQEVTVRVVELDAKASSQNNSSDLPPSYDSSDDSDSSDEERVEDDEEVTEDDDDSEHALIRVPSHPPSYVVIKNSATPPPLAKVDILPHYADRCTMRRYGFSIQGKVIVEARELCGM